MAPRVSASIGGSSRTWPRAASRVPENSTTPAQAGMRHLDLGKGDDPYKRSFATRALPLLEGSVMVPSLDSSWRRARTRGADLVHRSAALAPARSAWRQLRQWWSGREVSRAGG